jgi:hypothetical protein
LPSADVTQTGSGLHPMTAEVVRRFNLRKTTLKANPS